MSDLKLKLADLDEAGTLELVKQKVQAGEDAMAILEECREGMNLVGKRYEENEYYISDLMMAGVIFKQATELLSDGLKQTAGELHGKVVMGTVKGDIHDIGKDLVVGMLRANGYEVFDLGVDVAPEKFAGKVKETGAKVVGLSGLLTIAFDSMKDTITALDGTGVKVMIGGGMVDDGVREYVGADGVGMNAQDAVRLCDKWIREV